MKRWYRWQDWTIVIAGVWLFITPWVYDFTAETGASWNAWILGILVAGVGLWALGSPEVSGLEWSSMLLGVWLIVSPWAVSFTATSAAAVNAWIIGALVVMLAMWELAVTPKESGIGHGTPQHS